jgi:hypothetical protein
LVAHNPGLHPLALDLAGVGLAGVGQAGGGPAASLAEKYPTAALARFRVADWASLGEAQGKPGATLLDFVRPRDLPGHPD